MRWIHFALIAVTAGCSSYDTTQPKANPKPDPIICDGKSDSPMCPTLQSVGAVAGFVLNEADDCIVGAKVQVMDGPQAGASFTQTVCGFWDYGADLGYSFLNLPIGTAVKLKGTADGYGSAEISAWPSNPFQYTTYIRLKKN